MQAVLMDGLVAGVQLGLLATGLTLLYGLGGVLNLAHGAMAVAGAMVAALAMGAGMPAVPAVLLGIAVGALIGLLLDRTLMRPVYRMEGEGRVLLSLLLTLGVAFVIDGVLGWRYPNEALSLRIGGGPVEVLGVTMRRGSLVALAIAIIAIGVLVAFLQRTTLGRAIRSVIQSETGARLVGVDPARVRTLIFGLSGALAALYAVTQSMTAPVTVTSGFAFTTLALIVTVVGGLGSVSGALLAGILLGVVNALSSFYIGAYVTSIILLAAAAVTILVRPSGLRGTPRQRAGSSRSHGAASIVVGDRSTRGRPTWLAYAPIAVVAGLLALVPLVAGDSRTYMGLAFNVLVFAGYATALNVIFGSTGQLFLCLGALAGVSGYGVAILTDRVGWPLLVSLTVAVGLAAALGATFSFVSVRRSLDVIFTGIVTLTFSLAFENLLLGQRDLTGGETGLVVAAGEGTPLDGLVSAYLVLLVVVAGFLVLFRWLQRSHFGWAFKALRDDEMTAELAGVDVARYRIWAGGIGSAMIGLVGALQALHEGFISPATFAFGHVDVRTLVMLAFGGIATMLGPVIGAVSFGVIDELLRDLGQLRVAVYGGVLLVLFLGLRGGVGPAALALRDRRRARRHGAIT